MFYNNVIDVAGLLSCVMINPAFSYAKTKGPISVAVMLQLVDAFVSAT